MKHIVYPGYDNGVITMDCASARKNDYLDQSYFEPSDLVKLFDRGIITPRAISYKLNQQLPFDPSMYGSASTPYLAPTVMVQTISSFTMNPHYNNHYSFIQATDEHWIKKDLSCCDYGTTAIGGSANNEEELVVEDFNLFNSNTAIIDPAIISEMGEFINGKYIIIP
ncbi:MAG: hypothetical protein IPG55_00660 [Saprospiraceae bacterium]|nr:hypothetical protein [Candidatus Defluviibacterium haderslevense]MBK7243794.1 hypothetical protein [Candidatus Defluviibacterium haderslevense]